MELCGNEKNYQEIAKWIKEGTIDYNKKISYNDVIFVCGNSGIGKTYSIKKICENNNLYINYISFNNCSSSAELSDHITKITTSSLLQTLLNNKNPKILIIDDFDSILSADRTVNSTLLNILSEGKLKRIPIICISSTDMMKRVGNIKNKCKVIELSNPTKSDITAVLKKLYPNKSVNDIVEKYSSNLQQCIKNIENCDGKNVCVFDNVDELIDVNILYGECFDRKKITKVISTDPWIIPLRFHENMIIELKNRKITVTKINSLYKTFIINLINYDMLMHNTTMSNYISELFADIIHPILILPRKKNKNTTIASFTKLLSFISLQKKNIKKHYTTHFPLYQINNYHLNITRNYIHFN